MSAADAGLFMFLGLLVLTQVLIGVVSCYERAIPEWAVRIGIGVLAVLFILFLC